MNEEKPVQESAASIATGREPKLDKKPKKASARKLLQRELQARYRIYTPAKWAAEKAREQDEADKAARLEGCCE